jgi:outer membrane protein assembly factor BamB
VSAALGGETRSRDIGIWTKIPQGKTRWTLHPIGREIGDIPAVPGYGPYVYSLEQTPSGSTYLRADSANGIQIWTWLMPDTISNVELVCGDWLGGAIIAATEADSYTLYAVGNDGKLRWRHTVTGIRKSLAISTDHLVYLVSGSQDGTAVSLTGIDESSGKIRFDLALPSSRMIGDRVHRKGSSFVCASNGFSALLPIYTSRVIVNMDGLAYLAFTQRTRIVKANEACALGGSVDPKTTNIAQDDELILWQIHDDGTLRATAIETIHQKQPLSQSLTTMAPTRSIATDNMNGTLIPVEAVQQSIWGKEDKQTASFEYRLSPEGQLIYRFKMPQYTGTLHDEIVIAGNNLGFATRGDTLIAFNIETGKDLWHWKSSTDEIEVRAALANGHCLVQTPTALVEVESSTMSKVTAEGKFILNWEGELLKVHR